MRRKYWYLLGLCAQLSAFSLGIGRAQAQQLRPYFLVIVDTSGSMAWCKAGNNTGLLGVPGNNDCSCHVNGDCNAGFNTNRCGFPANKMGDAKCALQRIVDGVGGDATFGLMQFEHPCDNNCNPTGGSCSGTLQACGGECNDGQLAVEISSGNANLIREWVDGECGQGACGTNNSRHELTTGQWTPIAKSLQRANEYLRGQVNGSDPMPYVTGQGMWSAPLNNDPQLRCRPVSVILLTDGDDTCAAPTAAPSAAGALNTGNVNASTAAAKAFRTYVIGFGASGGNFNPAVLDQIAASGGTGNYYPAQNESELSVALSRIIADAQPPVEVCNNMDDDCDGNSDEGLPKFCNKPAGINAPELCDEPDETNCDGIDDDCDGVIDEGLTNACGACGAEPKEVCDAIDNDCDSRIDEDTNNMQTCGKDTGECKTGELVCVAGSEKCEGEIGPAPEKCDCKDNDCDGATDEENPDKLCAEGERCAGCNCVKFCDATVEFAASCPDGLRADIQPNGECLCIKDTCDMNTCAKETHENDGEVTCAPDNKKVAQCQCKAGTCVDMCNGVTCKSGETCNPKNGGCVEDSCRGLGCATGLLCDPAAGRCVQDACATAKCASDQVCRAGVCESSCASVTCGSGEVCKGGVCEENACAKKSCALGQVCDSETGDCGDDRCAGLQCKPGQECNQKTGKCEAEPCWNITCPRSQVCIAGECQLARPPAAGGDIKEAAGRLLATGGGGCACSVPGPQNTSGGAPLRALGVWLGLLGMAWLRRSRRRSAVPSRAATFLALGVAISGLSSLGGCRISPLCIDCVDAGSKDGPNSMNGNQDADGGTSARDAGPNGTIDAGGSTTVGGSGGSPSKPGDKCVPTGDEQCNDKDDDCDFKVDEDVVPTTNNCNQVGVCAGTTPICAKGEFICRFGDKYEMTESLCDGLDNDCNGKVDESFPMLGTTCEVGVGACKTKGVQRCAGSGKSLSCDAVPGTGSDEVCNGLDDDCDGMADEPKESPGTHPSYVHDDVVKLSDNLWIYAYEASRVDADATKSGIVTTRTCSRAGVLPWTNVTYAEAQTACGTVGMQLCNLNDWVSGCRGGNNCDWGTSSCDSYNDGTCNAHDPSTEAGQTETDALKTTGGKSSCFVDFGSAGKVFDMSGNAKEWTVGNQSPNQNPLRGGSYNNNPEALRCDFDFNVAPADLRLPNVGFRCCSDTEP
ncbi:MAG TPA: MopE-related protein [Polyangiales bacterium]|nr:MopE-related protein [Polyangiales bacterium]